MTSKAPLEGSKSIGGLSLKAISLARKLTGSGRRSSRAQEGGSSLGRGLKKQKETSRPKQRDMTRIEEGVSRKRKSPCKARDPLKGKTPLREEETPAELEDPLAGDYVVDDEGVIVVDDEGVVFDYYAHYSREQLEDRFDRYTDIPVAVPNEVLNEPSYITEAEVETLRKNYGFPPQYYIRVPGPKERICFPGDSEVGVYMGSFESGLRFPLIPKVAEFYK